MDFDKIQVFSDEVISFFEEELPPFATAHQLALHIHAMELGAEIFVPREGYVLKPEIYIFSQGRVKDGRLIERIKIRLGKKKFVIRDCGGGRWQVSNARISHFINFFENERQIRKNNLWRIL